MDVITRRELFLRKMMSLSYDKSSCYVTEDKYLSMVESVKQGRIGPWMNRRQRYLCSRYDVRFCGNQEKLIYISSGKFLVPMEESFDILEQTHLITGHGRREKMIGEINKKYSIPYKAVETFLSLCEDCKSKRNTTNSPSAVPTAKPFESKSFLDRGQVDLVDMESWPCRGYNWILVYQDHYTKFAIFRPLVHRTPNSVASQLLDIFTTIGAPSTLQSDCGLRFTSDVIASLRNIWPDLVIEHGNPRHSSDADERANSGVKTMVLTWMSENASHDWIKGMRFVQLKKNCTLHPSVGVSPFKATFGVELSKHALPSSHMPDDPVEDGENEIAESEEIEAVYDMTPQDNWFDCDSDPSSPMDEDGSMYLKWES